MRTSLRFTTFAPLILLVAAQALVQQRSITYQWLNEACAEVINCEGGCTACNLPDGSDAAFFGTNAAWLGVSTCPMPFALSDNAVFTEGWGDVPNESKGLVVSLIALAPTSLDSIALRHRAWGDGPERMRVSLRIGDGDWSVLHDGPVTDTWEKLSIQGQGCLAAQNGMSYGFAQLMVQAYGGGSGAWVIDELRVIGTDCQPDLTTGIAPVAPMIQGVESAWYDALGRAVGTMPTDGVYLARGKRTVVVQ